MEEYMLYIKGTNKRTKVGECWHSMLMRCTSEKLKNRYPTYIECNLYEEWKDFQKFAKWYKDNYYEIDSERMCLDKDILVKGNKIYSPDTCVFVPNRINVLFTNRKFHRGEFPIGVFKKDKRFVSRMSIGGKDIILGRYSNIYDAFNKYKEEKENYIKQIANEYKDKIPKKLYNALYNYKIKITD